MKRFFALAAVCAAVFCAAQFAALRQKAVYPGAGQFFVEPDSAVEDAGLLSLGLRRMESYRIKKYIGAYAAALGRVDAVVFTAGVGERAPVIREKALENLDILGIKYDKERNFASMCPAFFCVKVRGISNAGAQFNNLFRRCKR